MTGRFFAWGGMYPSEAEPPLKTTDGTRCGPVWRAAKLCLEAKMKKQLTIGLLAALTLTSPVWAEEVDEIVVSATGIPTPISQIGASVDVISAEDLEKQQITYLQDALKLKGINVPQNGGPGTLSNLFLRGLPGKYSALIVDGISMFDSGSNQVLWNDVIADGVAQVEILRGSQGVLYGSNSIAGVISQFSAIGGDTSNKVRLEAGGMGTQRLTLAGKGANGVLDYGYALSSFSADSVSASSNPLEGATSLEKDAYKNRTINGKASVTINESSAVSFVFRQAAGELDKDGFSSDAQGISEDFKRSTLGIAIDTEVGAWQHHLGLSDYDANVDDFSGGNKTGERLAGRQSIDYRGVLALAEGVDIIVGAENTTDEFENTDSGFSSFAKAEVDVSGIYTLVQWEPASPLNLTIALRQDDHELFGSQDTYRATVSYDGGNSLALRAAHGSGYRAPSLSELYLAFYGNADLQPETSISSEVGFDWSISNRAFVSATAFNIEVDDIIGYDPATYKNIQISGVSEISGLEIGAQYSPSEKVILTLDAAYTDSKKPNAAGGGSSQREVRVPRHQIGLTGECSVNERLSLGASLRAVRDTLDFGNIELDDYTLVNFRANYEVNKYTSAYFRIENATNEDYEIVDGYSTPDREFYFGITRKF